MAGSVIVTGLEPGLKGVGTPGTLKPLMLAVVPGGPDSLDRRLPDTGWPWGVVRASLPSVSGATGNTSSNKLEVSL